VRAADVWAGDHEAALERRRFTAPEAWARANSAVAKGYVDLHAHVYTYGVFLEIARDLREMDLIPFEVVASRDVVEGENEFLALLRKEA
jgi:hypothetical protein